MFGKNQKKKVIKSGGLFLEVTEIFKTFQGEGLYSGYPAIFIRLSGCNLACSFCDTDFDSYETLSVLTIIKKIQNLLKKENSNLENYLIVITGGEPFRQPIEKLCDKLIELKYKVQIETNGTLYRKLNKKVNIICSPKNNGNGYFLIREDLLKNITAFKFLISAYNKNYYFFGDAGQKKYNIPVYLQPMDEYNSEKNKKNMERVVFLAKKHNCRISLQIHKLLNIK